ncbi:MAG: hypothetical protein J6R96_00370 [Spirochaetaceae bacterium]|nr:hypothetical protein [Spirochaetaceae bacterium]
MKYAKTCFIVGLMMALAVGALAAETKKTAKAATSAPVYVTSSVKGLGTPILVITVDTPDSILNWFEDHGMPVDTVGTSLVSMPVPYRNELRKLYADDKYSKELRELAVEALKPYLTPGIIETVTTTYGPFTWTVSYNNEDAEKLVAPHKHDRNSDW